jgi:hypothetical protein
MTRSSPTTKLLDPLEVDAAAFIKTALAPLPVEQRKRTLAAAKILLGMERKPRKPTLAGVAKQAKRAALAVARYEVNPDGKIIVVTGKPESAEPENPWPLDEFRTKETKQ